MDTTNKLAEADRLYEGGVAAIQDFARACVYGSDEDRAAKGARLGGWLLALFNLAKADATPSADQATQPAEAVALLRDLATHDTYESEYDGRVETLCHGCSLPHGEHEEDCDYAQAHRYLASVLGSGWNDPPPKVPSPDDRVECSDCGKFFNRIGLRQHRKAKHPTHPAPASASEPVEQPEEAAEVIRHWNERAKDLGFAGVAGMLDAAAPSGFWIAPFEPDEEMRRSLKTGPGRWIYSNVETYQRMRDSWLERHPSSFACPNCNGTGARNSGGAQPWGGPIFVKCDCASASVAGAGEALKEKLMDIIAAALSGAYHCTRVWHAWSVGTMSEDDFEPVDESDTPAEIADAVIAALAARPVADGEAGPDVQYLRHRLERCLQDLPDAQYLSLHCDFLRDVLAALARQAPAPLSQAVPEGPPEREAIVREALAERQRQIDAEGYSTEHDDEHTRGEIAGAAADWLMPGQHTIPGVGWAQDKAKKPRRRQIIIGIALAIAEAERLARAQTSSGKGAE